MGYSDKSHKKSKKDNRMKRIINQEQLTEHGNRKGRKFMTEILEAGLQAADPYNNIFKLVRIEGNDLIFDNPLMEANNDPRTGKTVFHLDEIDRIFVFAIGKGLQRIAKALEDILGDRLTDGHVVAKHGDEIIMERIGVTLGAHPVPDKYCVIGCQKIVDIIKEAKLTERDLVITAVGNGVSALCTLPVSEIPLEDVMECTRLLQIEYGAPTYDLNFVRNHIDQLKGGKLTRMLKPAKMVHLFGVSPNINDQDGYRDGYSGYRALTMRNLWLHTMPDFTTAEGARNVIKKWDTKGKVSQTIVHYLDNFDLKNETMKYDEFEALNCRCFGVMPEILDALPAAMQRARELGFEPHYLSMRSQAEARHTGLMAAQIGMTVLGGDSVMKPPAALFYTGELLVTCGDNPGVGGRNQEYCVSAARAIAGNRRLIVGAVDTDGTDGPGGEFHPDATAKGITVLAGGLVDGYTAEEAKEKHVDLFDALETHATSAALWAVDSGVAATHNISIVDLECTLVMDEDG